MDKKSPVKIVLFLTFLVYSPALFFQFVSMDDPERILNNPLIRSLSPGNIGKIFTSIVYDTYMPLTLFSYALEYHFVRLQPFLYHLDNILLHVAAVFLMFRLALALGLRQAAALAAAFIFAFHPMHVEPVAWISERKGVLYSVFYLASVLVYLKFLDSRQLKDYGFSLGLALLSILAKPMAVSLPLVLLLCDWFRKGFLKKEDWYNKIPFAVIIVCLGGLTFVQSAHVLGQNIGSNPVFRFWAAAFYLKQFFFPVVLNPHYLPPMPAIFSNFPYWTSVLIIAATGAAFVLWKNRWFRLSLLWWFLSIFFLLNFDYPRFTQTVADRYMYLPSAGFCFFSGYVFERLWTGHSLSRAGRIAVSTGIAVFLLFRSFLYLGVWHDSFSLWDYAVKHSPQSFWAYNNRGKAYADRGDFEKALADYNQAVRINPYYAKTYISLAYLYENHGKYAQAMDNFSKAIFVNPGSQVALTGRGALFQRTGDAVSALADYDRALAVDPHYGLAYEKRGELFMQTGQWQEALSDFKRSLQLGFSVRKDLLDLSRQKLNEKSRGTTEKTQSPEFYNNRGQMYGMRGQADLALADFLKAIELKPDFDEAHNNAGIVFMMKGKTDEALKHFETASAIDPKNTEAQFNLGEFYYSKGHIDRAFGYYQKVIELNPKSSAALNRRGLIYGIKQKWDEALEDFNTALALDPRNREIYKNRGVVLEHKRMFKQALENYHLALALDPRFVDAYIGRGNVYASMRLMDEALKDFDKALAIDPKNETAAKAAAKIRRWPGSRKDY